MRIILLFCIIQTCTSLHSAEHCPLSGSSKRFGTVIHLRKFSPFAATSRHPISATTASHGPVNHLRGGGEPSYLFSSKTMANLAAVSSILAIICGAVWFVVHLDGKLTSLDEKLSGILSNLDEKLSDLATASKESTKAYAQVSGRMFFVEGLAVAILVTAVFPVKILMDMLVTNHQEPRNAFRRPRS